MLLEGEEEEEEEQQQQVQAKMHLIQVLEME